MAVIRRARADNMTGIDERDEIRQRSYNLETRQFCVRQSFGVMYIIRRRYNEKVEAFPSKEGDPFVSFTVY